MKLLSTWLVIGAALALTVAAGIVHGRLSNRWGPPGSMLKAAAQLRRIPESFGKWHLKSVRQLDDQTRNMLECAGEFVRTYVNEETGDFVEVMLIVGPPGPISEHTPEVCFSSQNYKRTRDTKRVTIEAPAGWKNELRMVDFQARDLAARITRVYYGWTAGDRWSAPANARFEFARKPHLYKIQAAGFISPLAESAEEDPIRDFSREFLAVTKNELVDASRE